MADGVHARVDAVQPARVEASRDRGGTEAQREQLAPGDDAVLLLRQRREGLLDESCSYIEHFSSSRGHP